MIYMDNASTTYVYPECIEQISDILQESATEKLTIEDVKQFLKRNKIGSNY